MIPRCTLLLRALCVSVLLVGLATPALPAADPIPVAQPISRYQKILEDSPFRKPTEAAPVAPPPPKDPGFWENLYVSGIMTVSGKNHVMLVQRNDSQRFLVATGEENSHGLSVVSIQFGDGHRQTRVTVKKGAEVGVVTFDQNAAGAVPQAPRGGRPPGIPGRPTPPPAFVPPGGRVAPPVVTPPPPARNPAINPSTPGVAPNVRPRPPIGVPPATQPGAKTLPQTSN